jgi:hypothetical protein
MVSVFVGAHPVGDGRGTRPASHRTQGGLLQKPSTSMSSPSAANRPQAQYVTRPLRFICREAQVALSDSTPHTAITPR